MKNKVVGLFFGSFNPITIGHLIVAKTVLDNTNIDELWFVITPENPYKSGKNELENANHRLEMVKMAIKEEACFYACDIEFNMKTPSYTSDTLKKLRNLNKEINFSIIVGTDVQLKINNWKNSDDIFNFHNIIVYPRTVSDEYLKINKLTDKIHSISTYLEDVPKIDISSTYVRNNIKSGKSIKYIVPNNIINYINNNNLFKKNNYIERTYIRNEECQSFLNDLKLLKKQQIIESLINWFDLADMEAFSKQNASEDKYMVNESGNIIRTLLKSLKLHIKHQVRRL